MDLWRHLVHSAALRAYNMAVDEALLREVTSTLQPVLRLYRWSEPALSLGYFQSANLVPEGRPFVRRYTGGGLVDHTRDITYTLVLPRAHAWMQLSAPASYARIHEGVRAALQAAGIGSRLTPQASSAESESCFQKPVKFDLVTESGDAKLGGAAQRRTREGLLQQGSILLPAQWSEKTEVVRTIFAEHFAKELGLTLEADELSAEEMRRTLRLEQERYGTREWNYSR